MDKLASDILHALQKWQIRNSLPKNGSRNEVLFEDDVLKDDYMI